MVIIEKVVKDVQIDKNIMGQLEAGEKVLSPGMKYRHYAPTTRCKLVYSEDNEKMVNEVKKFVMQNENTLILAKTENLSKYEGLNCIDIGSAKNLDEISHNIFSVLRKVDTYDASNAIIEGVRPEGLGLAIMNRLIRACEHDYIELK